MGDWLDGVAGPNFAPAVLWTLLALVILVILLVAIRVVRSMTFGTFVAGGRNRKTRLAVMDATAVDSHRRLVLVRRDDIEHLILIGGPTDVVVERDIRLHSPARRPASPGEPAAEAAQVRPRPVEPALPTRVEQRRPTAPVKPEQPAPQPVYRTPPPVQTPPAQTSVAQTSVAQTSVAQPVAPVVKPAPVRAPQAAPAIEPNFPAPRQSAPPPVNMPPPAAPRLKPLEAGKAPSAEPSPGDAGKKSAKPPELSLEDEMNRLLGELSKK